MLKLLLIGILLALSMILPGGQVSRKAPLPKIKHRVAVIAHRGGRALAPENTLAAFRKAIEIGADYVEIDVRATKDGALVLMHDRTVDRTTNGKGAVRDLDLAAIRRLDAGSKFSADFAGESVPTLDAALALCRGRINIYVDHKEAPTEQVWKAARSHMMEKQIIVYNGVDGLNEWKRIAPGVPVMPSLPDTYRRPGGVAEFEKLLPAELLDGDSSDWSKKLVEQAHKAGVKVYVDCLGDDDTPDGYWRAIALGVDGIQTDHPDRLIEALQSPRPPAKATRRVARDPSTSPPHGR